MTAVAILGALLYGIVICLIEVPLMRRQKLIRELWAFAVLLVLGVVFTGLVSFHVNILTPTELMEKVYAPLAGAMKSLLE